MAYSSNIIGESYRPFVLVLQRRLTRLGLRSLKIVCVNLLTCGCDAYCRRYLDLKTLCGIAILILEQKALCQQDPDQDLSEEAPDDQAEYDSMLISSACDLVSSFANALGPDFGRIFDTFFPLVAKYYVSPSFSSMARLTHAAL
jgi:importin-4